MLKSYLDLLSCFKGWFSEMEHILRIKDFYRVISTLFQWFSTKENLKIHMTMAVYRDTCCQNGSLATEYS